jgi:uncharacterized protein YjbI with pentapeptide repeats
MSILFAGQVFDKQSFLSEPLRKGEYECCTFKGCDLSGSDLSAFVFAECCFMDCNLSLAKLIKTTLRDVKFVQCKMFGLRFETCNPFALSFSFEGCLLDHSSFYQTKQKKTVFKDCRLHEVDLTECDLTSAVFNNCDFRNATFDRTILEKADLRTSYNYILDPENNKLKKACFSLTGLPGLLVKYGIEVD